MWIADAKTCREIDRRATEEFGVSVDVLMERAGLAVFDVVRELLPTPNRVTIVCGKGNNGGDGFVVARAAVEFGHQVDCLVAAREEELSADASRQMVLARAQGVQPIFCDDARWRSKLDMLCCRKLVVDALLGIGASQEVRGPIREAIHAINRSGAPVVAVDLPSGIACDTGEELGEAVWAIRTVTFGRPKPFLFQGAGIERSGYWTVSDIGFPRALLEEPTDARLVDANWIVDLMPERMRGSHKGDNGSTLIVAGSDRYRGAAALAARGALRAGAGLVTVASVPSVCAAVASLLPEAIVVELPTLNGVVSPDAAPWLIESGPRFDSAIFGPGLTTEPEVQETLAAVWANWTTPCVIDADGLNAIADGVRPPRAEYVLTPHPGEMSRLIKSSIAEVQNDRFRTIRHATAMFDGATLLKGAYSIAGRSGEPALINHTGNPGMATGGMGDVLSGVVGALLAQGLGAYESAAVGMFWHGQAADRCADAIGAVGYFASEVADALPETRCRMTAKCDRKPCR